jgi:dipeptidyl aminopeptidase/acylaminoacyl peptidase
VENQISPRTFFDITNLKWLPDGDGLLVAAKDTHDGRLRTWHVSTATGEARAITKDATDYISLSLDYVTINGSQNILWRQSLDNYNRADLIANLGNDEISGFALSPDESSFVFIRGGWIHDAVLIEGLK